MTKWKAEMPPRHHPRAHASDDRVCSEGDVEALVTRANEELTKVRAERDEARERLSSLSSFLGFGMGDDSTPLLELVTRVEQGTHHHTEVGIKTLGSVMAQRDAALSRVRELTEWRPMSEAPKGIAAEGPLVILSDGRGTEVTGFWRAGVWVTGLGPYFQPVAWLPLPEPPKGGAYV